MLTWRDMSAVLDAGMMIELMQPMEGRWSKGKRLKVVENGLNEMACLLVLQADNDPREDCVVGPDDEEGWDEQCTLFKIVENS
jgi:hypothetical protein